MHVLHQRRLPASRSRVSIRTARGALLALGLALCGLPSVRAADSVAVLFAGNYPGPPVFDDALSLSKDALAANLATWPNWKRGAGGNIVELPGNTTPQQFLAAIDPFTAGGARALQAGDFFLLFYFGHGGFYSTDELQRPASERAPALSRWEEGLSFPNGGAVSDNQLAAKFKQFNPGVIKAFVNISCFSGGFWGGNNPGTDGDLEQVPGTIFMASSIEALPTLTGNLPPRYWEPLYLRNLIFNLARNGRRSLTIAQWHALSFVPGTVTGFRLDDPSDPAFWGTQLTSDQEQCILSNIPRETDSPVAGNAARLAITYNQSNSTVNLSWPDEYIGARLQRSATVSPASWMDVAHPLTTNRVALSVAGTTMRFFQLNLSNVCDVAITKASSPNPVSVAGLLTYTMTVTNRGSVAASNVVVVDLLPENLSLVSANSTRGSVSNGVSSVLYTLGTLNTGEMATVTLVTRPTTSGSVTNVAWAMSDDIDSNWANNRATNVTTVTGTVTNYSVNVSAGVNGTVDPIGLVPKIAGQSLFLSASPNPGFWVDTWRVDGQVTQVGGSTFALYNIQSNRTVLVTFRARQLIIEPSAATNGTITPSSIVFKNPGENQTFTAAPNAGYTVGSWLVDGIVAQLGGTTYDLLNIQTNHSIGGTFSLSCPMQYQIGSAAGPNGGISPTGTVIHCAGDNQAFTATPDLTYVVDVWYVNGGAAQTNGASFTLSNIQANASVLVTFRSTNAPTTDILARYLPPRYVIDIGTPSATPCGCMSPDNPGAPGGNPQDTAMGNVFLHTGELIQRATDLAIPGRGMDWRFDRQYRSGMQYDGPLGQGWDFNYNRRLFVDTNGDVLRIDGLTRSDRYVFLGPNSYQAPSGYYTVLRTNGAGFIERDRHGMQWFYAPTNALGVAQMTNMTDRVGNAMTFQYNSSGQLTNVIDTLNRSITYNYDTNGHLTNVTDFIGRTLTFGYNTNGDLISATSPLITNTVTTNDFPNGRIRRYGYTSNFVDARLNHQLRTVVAPAQVAAGGINNARLVAQYITTANDPHIGRLKSVVLGGVNGSNIRAGGTNSYSYAVTGTARPDDYATMVFATFVTNRNGNVTDYYFNQLGNIRLSIQHTNGLRPGATATVTSSEYNKDGELTVRNNPENDSAEYTYETNSPNRHRHGNLLQVRRLPGSRGGDQTEILTSFTYESNFNFVATATDARTNVTRHLYDASGNRTNTIHRITNIVEDFEYNSFGQMSAHRLPANGSGSRRRDEMHYYTSGPQFGYLMERVTDAAGFNLINRYEYDAVGNVVRMIDARGHDSSNILNAVNEVIRTVSRETTNGSGVRYATDMIYDANGNVVRTEVPNVTHEGTPVATNATFTTSSVFDILDRSVRMTQEVDVARNIITEFRYDPNENRVLTRSGEAVANRQPANTVTNIYDERDLVISETRAPNDSVNRSTTDYFYDHNRNLLGTVQGTEDPGPLRLTQFRYDGYNRRRASIDALGHYTTNRYDANGNVTTNAAFGNLPGVTNFIRLSETRLFYDEMDRQTNQTALIFDLPTQVESAPAVTTTMYASNSQVTLMLDPNQHPTRTLYDTANRTLAVIDAKGNSMTNVYDANGNVTNTIAVELSDLGRPAQIFRTTNVYDSLDRLVAASDNIGNTTKFAYDSRGNRTLFTDAKLNRTTNVFDGLNRMLATIRVMSSNGYGTNPIIGHITTRQTWDDNSRLTSQIDDNTNATSYVFDSLNRQGATVYADTTFTTNVYDVHHNVILTKDANQTVVTNQYDLLNRVTNKLIAIATNSAVRATTTREGFAYDGLSRLMVATNDQTKVTRTFDSLGRVLSETQVLLGSPAPSTTVASIFDAVGNQLECRYPGGRRVLREFDSLNRQTNISSVEINFVTVPIARYFYVGPGRVERRTYGNGAICDYAYDDARRITGTSNYLVSNGTNAIIDARALAWDANDNKVSRADVRPGGLGQISSYIIDSANRLVQTLVTGFGATNRAYPLDGAGNRTYSYTLNAVNEYTTTPFDTRGYDAEGNLSAITNGAGVSVFAYDYRNLMVGAQPPGQSVLSYIYDALGRRVAKVIGSEITRFLYASWQELEEADTGGTTEASYIYGNYVDEALTMNRGSTNVYYHTDDIYNITALSDFSGNVVERSEYDDYGSAVLLNPSGTPLVKNESPLGNPLLFSGRRYDAETGWYYYRARYLEPSLGRFNIRDPLGLWVDLQNAGNSYAGFGNQPGMWRDPSGLWKIARLGQRTAKARPTKAGETIRDLARKIGLNAPEYRLWLTDSPLVTNDKLLLDDQIKQEYIDYDLIEFEVPNTAYIDVGDYLPSAAWHLPARWLSATDIWAQAAKREWTEQGLFVVRTNPELTPEVVHSHLWDKYLYKYMYIGHGNGGALTLEASGKTVFSTGLVTRGANAPIVPETRYGIFEMRLYACGSDDARDNWRKNVSMDGTLTTRAGLLGGVNSGKFVESNGWGSKQEETSLPAR